MPGKHRKSRKRCKQQRRRTEQRLTPLQKAAAWASITAALWRILRDWF